MNKFCLLDDVFITDDSTLFQSCTHRRVICVQYDSFHTYFSAHELIRPHVKELVQQILRILRESENDELTGTISKLVQSFTEEVASISLELVHTLVRIRFRYAITLCCVDFYCCIGLKPIDQ